MSRRTSFRVVLLLMACLMLPFAAQASRPAAQGSGGSDRQALQQAFNAARGSQEGVIDQTLRSRTGQLGIVIELNDAPTTQIYAQAQSGGPVAQATLAAQAQLARVNRAQQNLLAPLAQMGAQVLYRTQRTYNGIAARVDAGKLSQIAALPGVKAIHQLVRHERDLEASVPLIGAPQLWQGVDLPSELTGDGLTIAVIDTGIDYIHAGFGGPGTQAVYDANNTTIITDSLAAAGFPTAKVIAGYDFAGDAYTGFNTPQPDPDPMDCNGHGSHVAGIAAGNGVLVGGSTFSGPYNDPNLYTNNNFEIGPGVAPEASLVALRVFGCDGSTELASEAIEWAIDPNGDGNFDDRVDVINMSLGSDFGATLDSTSVAADNAVLAGTIVVASAGNDADSYFITGSPATSPRVISVASSADAIDILDGFIENSPDVGQQHPASLSVAYDWTGTSPVTDTNVTGDLVYPPTQRTGCAAFSPANQALIAGKIVLLDWTDGECGSVTRGLNLYNAGAIGGILVDNTDAFDLFITGSNRIPMVSAPKAVGQELKADLGVGAVNLTLTSELVSSVPYADINVSDTLSAFSSRGPRRNGSALKPDISAPGQGIFSVGALTGTRGANISGTSMAAPHVAGAMALMRQLHPTWTIEELKALVMNTAVNNIRSDLPQSAALFPPSRIGAGRIDLPRAAASEVVAYQQENDNLISVSFGNNEVINTATATRTVTVFNKGASPVTYNLAYVPIVTASGVTYSLSATSVTVPASGSADVVITMNANAAQMKHFHDQTVAEVQGGFDRPWLSEASGYLALTESGLPISHFAAWIDNDQENPPSTSNVRATAVFTYTGGNIDYAINFTAPITLTAAHFHSGPAGANGPVVIPIPTGDTTFGPGDPLIGTAASVSAPNAALLLQGGLYVNFHTAAFPGGEIRGQVVPALTDTQLRVPVYANARPASDMEATVSSIDITTAPNLEATLVLTGTGVNTGNNRPYDVVSLVSAFELQDLSPNEAASTEVNDKADLAYVGVASTIASAGTLTDTMLYFAVATHADWSTPNEVEFDIYIDTNRDGEDDFVLFNSNLGQQSGLDQNDALLTFLLDLNDTDNFTIQDYVNGVSPANLDTVVFNNNVLILPVFASDLGLTAGNSRFNYRVETFSLDSPGTEPSVGGAIAGKVDESEVLSFDAATPGVDTTTDSLNGPTHLDLPGEDIVLKINPSAFVQSRSRGVLLLHHHNAAGDRVQIIATRASRLYLPILMR